MSFPPSYRNALLRLFLVAIVFGLQSVAAQMPSPDGVERHPSDYQHPLRTWTQREPTRSNLGRVRDRQTSLATLNGKLQSIVIPRIEFRRTTLSDAVEYLRQESRRLDPDHRGVTIHLRLPRLSPTVDTSIASVPGLPLLPADANTRITLMVERLPLLEALRYVAAQAGLKVAVEPDAVAVVPPNVWGQGTLLTDNYQVPPELLGRAAGSGVNSPRVDLQAWFEAKGVEFPSGASAIYEPDTQKLIVRNAQENLDKIVSVISSALKPLTPPNP